VNTRVLEYNPASVENCLMELIHDDLDDPTTGTRVVLTHDAHTLWEGYWPGPHHPGEEIYSTDRGSFVFDHHDTTGPDDPVAVYSWVADRKKP
jgi:hypothetical protein